MGEHRIDPGLHWRDVYERKASEKVSWYQDVPRLSLEWIQAVAPASDNPRIVDVGAGASSLVDHLLAGGYERITVLDVAQPALEEVATRLGERARAVEFIVADLLTFHPGVRYDIWHDRAVLHFLRDPADQKRYADILRSSLLPGGHALIATFGIGGPERCSGLPTVQYDSERLMAVVGPDFELVRQATEEHRTPSGAAQLFAYFLLRRSEPDR